MGDPLDLAAIDAFLAEPRNAVVAGVRRDGRPHLTPNWFVWDGSRFYVSTTKDRVKYRVFTNDPRAQLVIDDVTGFRYVVVEGTAEVADDVEAGLPWFRAIRAKHGRAEQTDEELRDEMTRDRRVLLIITPDRPQDQWLARGF
jgi:PPOX class probable F420-dependent enzyme